MTAFRSATTARSALWVLTILCLLALAYVMLATYALNLGAAHHDAFCPEHGWAV